MTDVPDTMIIDSEDPPSQTVLTGKRGLDEEAGREGEEERSV
jgi:hypothetical protein